jgi:glutamate racemase
VNKNNPIGIFDSGIGGLTVAKAIRLLLPNESLLYFGDTKHLPYGEKSSESIQEFSEDISQFLKKKGCKMIVIACNTASSVAYESVKKQCPKIEIVNVIDPVIRRICSNKGNKTIGIIGTKGTINSQVYPEKIKAIHKHAEVKSLATPLLAAMIEEGFFNDKISEVIIHNYLKQEKLNSIDQLILACTHYPLIQALISDFYQQKVEIIDSASEVALHIKNILTDKNLLSQEKSRHRFYVSDYTDSFEKSAKMFFGEDIQLEEVKLSR